jgi:hypothetical protein
VCVYIDVCTYTCIRTHHTHIHTDTYIHCIHENISICMHACMYVHIYGVLSRPMCVCVCVCIHKYIHTMFVYVVYVGVVCVCLCESVCVCVYVCV